MGTLALNLVNVLLRYKHMSLTFFLPFCSYHINFYRKHTLFVRFQIQLLWLVMTKQSCHHHVLTDCPYLFSSWGLSIAYPTHTKQLTQTIIQLYKDLDHFGTFQNHFVASLKFKFLKRSSFLFFQNHHNWYTFLNKYSTLYCIFFYI